jgi:hypothetical protein
VSGERGVFGSFGAALGRVAQVHQRVWYRLVPPLAVIFLAYVVGLAILAVAMRPFLESQAEAARTSGGDATLLTLTVLVPMVVLLAVFGLVWAGAAVFVADGAAADRATSPWRSTTQAARRLPGAFLVVVLWFLAVVASFVLTPLAVVVGIGGLLLTPLARRRSPSLRPSGWPSVRTLVVLAIPFAAMVVVATRLALAPAALFLDGVGVRESFAMSWRAVRGRTGTVCSVLLTTVFVIVVFSLAVRALVDLALHGDARLIVSQLAAHVLVAPLLLVAIAVLYRAGGPAIAPKVAVAPVRGSHRTPIGLVLVISLIVSLGTVLQSTVQVASATETSDTTAPAATETTATSAQSDGSAPSPPGAPGVPRALVGTTVPEIRH